MLSVRTSQLFQNPSKQNKFQAKTLFTTGETVGLAEWIIDDTCLIYVLISIYGWHMVSDISFLESRLLDILMKLSTGYTISASCLVCGTKRIRIRKPRMFKQLADLLIDQLFLNCFAESLLKNLIE